MRGVEGAGQRGAPPGPGTHPSPWAAGRPGSDTATQHNAFSRRCSRKSWVTCASGSTAARRGRERVPLHPDTGMLGGHGGGGHTWVAGRAVDGLPRDALDGPVAVDEEAVAQGVAEPLHGRRHGPAVGQGHAPGAAEEGSLRGERGGQRGTQGTRGTPAGRKGLPCTHGQEVEAAVQAGLDPQGGRHVDLGQGGHGDGVAGAFGQVDGAERQVDGQEVSPRLLPCGDSGSGSGTRMGASGEGGSGTGRGYSEVRWRLRDSHGSSGMESTGSGTGTRDAARRGGPYRPGGAGAGGGKPWRRRGRSAGRGRGAAGRGAAPRRGRPASGPPRGAGAGGAAGSRAGCRPGPRGRRAAGAPAPPVPSAGAGRPGRSPPAAPGTEAEGHQRGGGASGRGRGFSGRGGVTRGG